MKRIVASVLIFAFLIFTVTACKKGTEKKTETAPTEKKTADTQKADDNKEKKDEEKEKQIKEAEEKLESDGTGVAIIDDDIISQEYYNYMYITIYKSFETQYSEEFGENWLNEVVNGKTLKQHIKESTEEQIKRIVAVNIVAEEYGIFPDNEDIKESAEKEKASLLEFLGGQEEFEKHIQECRSSDEAVTKYIGQFEVYYKAVEKFQEEYDKKAKEDSLKTFNDTFFKVQYIFVSTEELIDANGNPTMMKSDSEALFVANSVVERLDSGEDFNELIDVYNEDSSMFKNSYHMFSEETVQAELFEAVKKLKAGEYTKNPVALNSGYYVIKRYVIDENDENFKQYYSEESGLELYDIIQDKIKDIPVVFKYDVIDPYIDSWINTLSEEKEG